MKDPESSWSVIWRSLLALILFSFAMCGWAIVAVGLKLYKGVKI